MFTKMTVENQFGQNVCPQGRSSDWFPQRNKLPFSKTLSLAKFSHFLLFSALLTNRCDRKPLKGGKWCAFYPAKQIWAPQTKHRDTL